MKSVVSKQDKSQHFKFAYAVETNCARERVYAIFTDNERWQRKSVFGERRWVEGKPWEVGSRLEYELIFPGLIKVSRLVIAAEPERHLGFISHGLGITCECHVEFGSRADDGTRVEINLESVGPRVWVFGLAVETALVRIYMRVLDDLKVECDKQV